MTRRTLRLVAVSSLLMGSATLADEPRPTSPTDRKGDEIIVCGQFLHTGTPVVTWIDPGGYDAYNTARRFPGDAAAGATAEVELGFRTRRSEHAPADGQWTLTRLQRVVDQFVIHYDVCGTSRRCFRVLHDERGLAVQFMLDLDGTIYQTLDLKECAWHATKANDRSVGIEIANMGAVPKAEADKHFGPWYKTEDGQTVITIPGGVEKSGLRDRAAPLKPSRPGLVSGTIHGTTYEQYDLTDKQYEALIKLVAALHRTFPKIKLDYPRRADGKLLPTNLPDDAYDRYEGVLGHFHVQANKQDPGPAFRWDKVIEGAREASSGK